MMYVEGLLNTMAFESSDSGLASSDSHPISTDPSVENKEVDSPLHTEDDCEDVFVVASDAVEDVKSHLLALNRMDDEISSDSEASADSFQPDHNSCFDCKVQDDEEQQLVTAQEETVRMLLATKQSKDDCTAVTFEDYQVQYFLIENPTAADDGSVTTDHEKIPAGNESVLPYSAACTPLPAPDDGGKGSVGDSGNFTVTTDTNGDDLSSTKPGPPLKMCRAITYATCYRSGSESDDSDPVPPPPLANTFVVHNYDEEEEEEGPAPVEESGLNGGSWSHTFKHVPIQYTTDDWNFLPGFLISPVEEDPANIVQPQPVSSPLDTGQPVSQHPLAKPPWMGLYHHSPEETGQLLTQHPLAKPPRIGLHHHGPEDKEEMLVTPEEESVMPFSQVVITHSPPAVVDLHQQPPPDHGPFPSPSALDDELGITDHHLYLTTSVEESGYPGASASLVTGYN